jgi:hypothetical protein
VKKKFEKEGSFVVEEMKAEHNHQKLTSTNALYPG